MVGFDPAHGHSVQRSFTVHGDEAWAQRRRCELVEDYGIDRVGSSDIPGLNVAELLTRFMAGPHPWKPATYTSHRHVVDDLVADPVARRPLLTLTAGTVRATIVRWQVCGVSVATVSARWLVLRSAISWAVTEGLLRSNPLVGVRGPPRPRPRLHHTIDEVHRMLTVAEADVARLSTGLEADPTSLWWRRLLFSAEQALLLVRVAADSGARRGELAVLRHGDVDGRVLTIQRGVSHGVIGSTKSNRSRRLTLGATTVTLIETHWSSWASGDRRRSTTGCSHPRRPGRRSSPPMPCRTSSAASASPPESNVRRFTVSVTPWPPISSATGSCSRPKHVSGTVTR